QSEACPCSPSALCDPPGLLSFFKLVYCHCSFVALGGKMPPSAFFIGGVLKAGGRGGWGIEWSVLPSVSGALRALAKSRELAFGSHRPASYASPYSTLFRSTVGGLPLPALCLVRPSRVAFFFQAGLSPLQFCRAGREDAAIGFFYRKSFEGGRSWWLGD